MSTKNYNKIVINNEVIIDLTSDTVTPETLLSGRVAHSADGSVIVGVKEPSEISEVENLVDNNNGYILDSSGNPILSEIGYVTKTDYENAVIGLKNLLRQYEEAIELYKAQEQNYVLDSNYIPVKDLPVLN